MNNLSFSKNTLLIVDDNPKQIEIIRELGCIFGQGYFFSRPLDSQNATRFIG